MKDEQRALELDLHFWRARAERAEHLLEVREQYIKDLPKAEDTDARVAAFIDLINEFRKGLDMVRTWRKGHRYRFELTVVDREAKL